MPEISIIIPTYNRLEEIRSCIESLCHQSAPVDSFEVIVVVDGSDDGSREYLQELVTPFELIVIWQKNNGRSSARNRGAEVSNSRYLLFIDDDMVASEALVSEHLRIQKELGGVVGIGNIVLRAPSTPDWFAKNYIRAWRQHYTQFDERSPGWQDLYGGNVSVTRSMFLDVGGFAEDFPRCEDVEFGYRLWLAGLAFTYIRTASGTHIDYKPYRRLVAESEAGGAAMVHFARRHPGILKELSITFRKMSAGRRLCLYMLLQLSLPTRYLFLSHLLLPLNDWKYSWYKLVRQYFYWRGIRQAFELREPGAWNGFRRGVPILMYHAFCRKTEESGRYVISKERFTQQMLWLYRHQYHVIGLEEYARVLGEGRPLKARTVVLTIDDGYAEVVSIAMPILQHLGFTASFLLASKCVGSTNSWDRCGELAGRPLVSWGEAQAWLDTGMEIGAHTRTHPHLPELIGERIEAEVLGAREDIESHLGVKALAFSYPYGEYNEMVMGIAEQAGFVLSCNVDEGLNYPETPIQALRRVEVRGNDLLSVFIIKVRFGTAKWAIARGLRRYLGR